MLRCEPLTRARGERQTLIDLHFLGNALVVVLSALFTRVQQLIYDDVLLTNELADELPSTSDVVGILDVAATGVLAMLWLSVQTYFTVLSCRYSAKPRIHDAALQDEGNMVLDQKVAPQQERQAQDKSGRPLMGTLMRTPRRRPSEVGSALAEHSVWSRTKEATSRDGRARPSPAAMPSPGLAEDSVTL